MEPAKRAERDDAHQRDSDRQREQIRMRVLADAQMLPEEDSSDAHHAENRAEHESRRQSRSATFHQSRTRISPSARGADYERRRLRSGVSAGADDERNEEREHHRLGELVLKVPHRRRCQHLAQKERRQPGRAFSDHREESDLGVGLVQRFHAAEALYVFGVLLDQRVDDVVDRDDS